MASRRFKRGVLVTGLVPLAAVAVWLFVKRDALGLQWDCYQVTSATDEASFEQQIERFLEVSNDPQRWRALLARWHTGNDRFDQQLARYLYSPKCSETFRQAFSLELSWRPGLFSPWAEHWRRVKEDPEHEQASIRRYLEALHAAEPARTITWRDILDLQAVLELDGQGELAHRLTPDNWRGRYERWVAAIEPPR